MAYFRNQFVVERPGETCLIQTAFATRTLDLRHTDFRREFEHRTRRSLRARAVPVRFSIHAAEEPDAPGEPTRWIGEAWLDGASLGITNNALIPVIPVSKLSDLAQRNRALAAINATFFAHAEEEFVGTYSAFKEPAGLIVSSGKLLVPPSCRRGVLIIDQDGKPHLDRLSMQNVTIQLPGDLTLHGEETLRGRERDRGLEFVVAPHRATGPLGRILLYSRTHGLRTPPSSDRVELGVFYEHVILKEPRGDHPIPDSGFVISIPLNRRQLPPEFKHLLPEIRVGQRVKLRVYPNATLWDKGCRKILEAVRGLRVLRWDPRTRSSEVIPEDFFRQPHPREEWQEDWYAGETPPTKFTYDVLGSPAARTVVGLGLTRIP